MAKPQVEDTALPRTVKAAVCLSAEGEGRVLANSVLGEGPRAEAAQRAEARLRALRLVAELEDAELEGLWRDARAIGDALQRELDEAGERRERIKDLGER